jgi:ribulose-5-phosphate 4-epimerase/fuculose-1-phosphate aldolase
MAAARGAGKLRIPSLKKKVGAKEWQARVELAACYRLMAHHGWVHATANHISAKVPGEDGNFLINPYGLLFDEITASSLVKIDSQGEVLSKTPFGINRAGYVIHSAVYDHRPDVTSVIHTHTVTGMAVSAMEEGLQPLFQTGMRFYKRVGYHDYEGPAEDLDERKRMAANLGPHMALILRNHGLLTIGRSVGEAFGVMYSLEKACLAQLLAQSSGAKLITPSAALCESTAGGRDARSNRPNDRQWQAWMRLADRLDPSYRT